jgi:hypothetical protein
VNLICEFVLLVLCKGMAKGWQRDGLQIPLFYILVVMSTIFKDIVFRD